MDYGRWVMLIVGLLFAHFCRERHLKSGYTTVVIIATVTHDVRMSCLQTNHVDWVRMVAAHDSREIVTGNNFVCFPRTCRKDSVKASWASRYGAWTIIYKDESAQERVAYASIVWDLFFVAFNESIFLTKLCQPQLHVARCLKDFRHDQFQWVWQWKLCPRVMFTKLGGECCTFSWMV